MKNYYSYQNINNNIYEMNNFTNYTINYLNNLIFQNNISYDNYSLLNENDNYRNKVNSKNFDTLLHKKRYSIDPILNNNIMFLPENKNLALYNNNNIQLGVDQISFKSRSALFYDYEYNIQKLEFNNYLTNNLTNIPKDNIFMNNNINKIKENINNDNNIRKELCNDIIKYKNNSLINNSNKTITEKKNVFNVIHIKQKRKYIKKEYKKYSKNIKKS